MGMRFCCVGIVWNLGVGGRDLLVASEHSLPITRFEHLLGSRCIDALKKT